MQAKMQACAIAMLMMSLALPMASIGAGSQNANANPDADPAQWRAIVIREAVSAASLIQDPYRAGETFALIARAQVAIGDEQGAEASLRFAVAKVPAIEQSEFRGWVQHEIVRAQLALNDVIGAQQTSAGIAADRPHGASFVLLARRALQSGNMQTAAALAASIREPTAAGEILSELVATRVSQGDLIEGRAIQRRIDDRDYSAIAEGYIAIGEARAGKLDRARAIVKSVPRSQRPQATGQLISWLGERGETQSAIQIAGDIDDPMRRANHLARLALDTQRSGNPAKAKELFAAALELATKRTREPRELVARIQVARLMALAGYTSDATGTLQLVERDLASVQGKDRDLVLEALARAYVRLDVLDRAWAVGAAIQDRISRALLIRDIAALQAARGMSADKIVQLNPTEDPLAGTAAQFGILAARLGREAVPPLRATIEAARRGVARIDDPLLPPPALASLAAASVRAGAPALGREIFAELLAAGSLIERPDWRALAYVRAANALNDRLMFLGRPADEADRCGDQPDCESR
jgi:hypothetical protein